MSAMTQQRQQVYVSDGFSEPMSAQHNFANNFDLDNPDAAMSAYQKYVILIWFFVVSPLTFPQDHARAHQAPTQHCHRLSPSTKRCLIIAWRRVP